jgi:hypothetical protein
MPDLKLIQTDNQVVVAGPDFELALDQMTGRIAGLSYQGQPLLVEGPQLNLWRAATDNDGFK